MNSRKSKKSKKSCPKGQIMRRSYSKKGHFRRSYRRSDGVKVKPAYISSSKVERKCVKDVGQPGKTPLSRQVLPKPGKELSLRKYGYSTDRSDAYRRKSLRRASKDHNELKVLKRLNLLRNYQADKHSKEVMSEDVKYMSRLYKKAKSSKE